MENLPGSVFLRGPSVTMMVEFTYKIGRILEFRNFLLMDLNQVVLQPDDLPKGSQDEKHVLLTIQPRVPAASLAFSELPAGMVDDSGTFVGAAAKEIKEELGI